MGSFTSNSPDETFELGRQWAADVSAGWVIGLMGDLGTGKTQLVKGLAAGLGVEATVNSPTFALLQEHDEGRLRWPTSTFTDWRRRRKLSAPVWNIS